MQEQKRQQTSIPEQWGLKRLEGLLVPPMLEEALGYCDEAHFLCWFWESGELYCEDGLFGHPVDEQAWQAWISYQQNASKVALSFNRNNDMWLLLDTSTRSIFTGWCNEIWELVTKYSQAQPRSDYNPATHRTRQAQAYAEMICYLERATCRHYCKAGGVAVT